MWRKYPLSQITAIFRFWNGFNCTQPDEKVKTLKTNQLKSHASKWKISFDKLPFKIKMGSKKIRTKWEFYSWKSSQESDIL